MNPLPGSPLPAAAAFRCGDCAHFRNDPAFVEQTFPGLSAMSSGAASVRAHDGLCARHGPYLPVWDRCPDFAAGSRAPGEPILKGAG